MTAHPSPASDDPDLRWFEVLGGEPPATGEADDAVALRQVLGRLLDGPQPAPVVDAGADVSASLALLLKRLDRTLADEDRAWFEAIGGVNAIESDGVREGRQLRGALLPPEAPAPAVAESRSELLKRIAALTPAVVPAPRAMTTSAGGWQRWSRWLLGSGPGHSGRGLALAGAMALAIGIGVVWQDRPEPELERGADGTPRTTPGGSPVFDVSDPEQAARSFAQALGRAGVTAVVVQEAGSWNVRTGLPEPLGAAVQQVLQRNRVPVPADRRLEVVFVKKP